MTLDAATAAGCAAIVWKTRDGRELRWSEMTAKHLRNCAEMLRRRGVAHVANVIRFGMGLRGDAAQYAAEQELAEAEDVADRAQHCARMMEAYAAWRETTLAAHR